MSDFDVMDTESDYEPSSSGENESEYEPSLSGEDDSEYESMGEDDSEYEPSSLGEDDSEYESMVEDGSEYEPSSITLKRHHLGAVTDLEVGTVIRIGDTVGLRDGSFLEITELILTGKKGRLVDLHGNLFRPVEDFRDFLPTEFGGSEVVWLCEARKDDLKPQGFLRTASSKAVVRQRHLVRTSSDPASESSAPIEATGMSTDANPLFCRWKLVAELTNSKTTKRRATRRRATSFRSVKTGSIGLPKAFIALSSEELSVGPPAQNTELEGSSEQKKYTYADAFCGAGGMSQGAKDAGLQISWAFDNNEDALKTYRANHGDVGFQLAAEDFELEASRKPEGHFKVDFLHFSPECKELSLAYKGPSRDALKHSKMLDPRRWNCGKGKAKDRDLRGGAKPPPKA